MDRIFHAGWVFVGHDSGVPRPGDYVTRHLGREPVIMVRDKDGGIAVLVNRCMHRGTMLYSAERGSVRTFACPYHGWTYDLSGDLTTAPASTPGSSCCRRGIVTAKSLRRSCAG